MGFFDKAKTFMDSATDAMERNIESKINNMSDSELLELYERTESDRLKAKVAEELRQRGLL